MSDETLLPFPVEVFVTDRPAALHPLTLDALLQYAKEQASHLYQKEDELALRVRLFANVPANSVLEVRFPVTNRHLQTEVLKQMIKDNQVDGYVVITEAWDSRAGDVSPSQDPQRQEILLLVAVTKSGTKTAVYDICRGPDGKVAELKEGKLIAPEGWMYELFQGPGRVH